MTPSARTLPWDWYAGVIPENVVLDETAYLQTSFVFHLYRSRQAAGVEIHRAASVYLGTMFDVGPHGRVSVGEYSLVNGARIICDERIEIGDYALISWNVVLMDTYRVPLDAGERRQELVRAAHRRPRLLAGPSRPRPIRISRNVWIGFDACILPGVTIGEGSVVGARTVVVENVPPYTVVAGNPARIVRRLEKEAERHAS
jgi:acetyltransferase-like isoleucine patch superfamily enzyme